MGAAVGLSADIAAALARARLGWRLRGGDGEPRPPFAPVEVFGLRFPAPLGVAAGVDRSGRLAAPLAGRGFGFIEVGTLTPRPVLLRNPGAAAVAASLARVRPLAGGAPVGVNAGSLAPGWGDAAADEVAAVMAATLEAADFFVVNLSAPQRPGLGDVAGFLQRLMKRLSAAVPRTLSPGGRGFLKPLLVKVDIARDADALVKLRAARACGCAGAVAVGDAGRLAEITAALPGWPLISVGGVASPADVAARLAAGAALVQTCSALLRGDFSITAPPC